SGLRVQALGLPREAVGVVVLRLEPPDRGGGEVRDDLLGLVARLLVVEPDGLPVSALVERARAGLVVSELRVVEPGMDTRLDDGADGGDDVVVRPGGRRRRREQ